MTIIKKILYVALKMLKLNFEFSGKEPFPMSMPSISVGPSSQYKNYFHGSNKDHLEVCLLTEDFYLVLLGYGLPWKLLYFPYVNFSYPWQPQLTIWFAGFTKMFVIHSQTLGWLVITLSCYQLDIDMCLTLQLPSSHAPKLQLNMVHIKFPCLNVWQMLSHQTFRLNIFCKI